MSDAELKPAGHIAFLRQAASALRDLAVEEPKTAEAIRFIANQIETDADELAVAAGLKGIGFA